MKAHAALAEALPHEGVRAIFGLLGDGNLDFLCSVLEQQKVDVYDVRHEGAGLSMADGWSRATDDVGVCTVHYGPGVTQLGTAMTVATRHRSPIVVIAGDLEASKKGINGRQDLDQRRFATATGALFVQLRSPDTVAIDVRTAFLLARTERLPVFLNCPVDIQLEELGEAFSYRPSTEFIGETPVPHPNPRSVAAAAEMIAAASRPVIVAGAGATGAEARREIDELGDRIGAALGTTIRATGYLDGEWGIGICGYLGSPKATYFLENADLVLFAGSSANADVSGNGNLFPQAKTIQLTVDANSTVNKNPPDLRVVGDARLAIAEINDQLKTHGHNSDGFRTPEFLPNFHKNELAYELEEADWQETDGEMDPRRVAATLGELLPMDCNVVTGTGHACTSPWVYLPGKRSRRFLTAYDFGCLGNGIVTAIGVALAEPTRTTVAFEGDAGALMNIQELDTAARYGAHILIIVMNDGKLGAEQFRLRATDRDPEWAVVRGSDFAAIGRAFGIPSRTVVNSGELEDGVAAFLNGTGPALLEVKTSQVVVNRRYRRSFFPSLVHPVDETSW